MSDDEKTRSLARAPTDRRSRPFDGVRRELAVVLVFGAVCALLIAGLDLSRWLEITLLAGVGFAAGGWIAGRTRAAERKVQRGDSPEGGDGPQ